MKAVEAALADGRIVQADRDHRIAQLRQALTASEAQMVVHDLAHRDVPPPAATWETYSPSAPPPPRPAPPPPPPPAAVPATAYQLFGQRRTTGGAGCAVVPLVVFLLVAGGIVSGVVGAMRDDPFDSQFEEFEGFEDYPDIEELPEPEVQRPPLFQPAEFERMREAIQAEAGSTTAFEVMLYPSYARVVVPAAPTGKRALAYTYDGELDGAPTKERSLRERFDLTTVDATVIPRLVRQARRTLVEDPTNVFVMIERPDDVARDGWLTVYVSNDDDESGYLAADLDGTVVDRYVTE